MRLLVLGISGLRCHSCSGVNDNKECNEVSASHNGIKKLPYMIQVELRHHGVAVGARATYCMGQLRPVDTCVKTLYLHAIN